MWNHPRNVKHTPYKKEQHHYAEPATKMVTSSEDALEYSVSLKLLLKEKSRGHFNEGQEKKRFLEYFERMKV